MDIWNLGASLGIGGLIAIGFYKIAMVLIRVWTAGDTARTKVTGDGFKAITDSHAALIEVVRESNQAMIAAMNDQRRYIDATFANIDKSINALEVRVSTALDLTPVRGVPKIDMDQVPPPSSKLVSTTVIAGVIEARVDETPRSRPGPTERAKSQGGVVTGGYFERSTPMKKKP